MSESYASLQRMQEMPQCIGEKWQEEMRWKEGKELAHCTWGSFLAFCKGAKKSEVCMRHARHQSGAQEDQCQLGKMAGMVEAPHSHQEGLKQR